MDWSFLIYIIYIYTYTYYSTIFICLICFIKCNQWNSSESKSKLQKNADTVKKQKIEQQPEPSWEGPHEKSLLWPGVRSAYRSYTDFPCQQVLEAWVSGKSANLNHHFWLQKSEKKLSLQQIFTSLQKRRRETPLKKQDFFVKLHQLAQKSNSGTFASALQALRWVRHLDHLHNRKVW